VVPELAMWRATRSAGEPYGPRMSLMRARSRVVLRFVRRRRLADGATFALDASLLPLAPTTNYGDASYTSGEIFCSVLFNSKSTGRETTIRYRAAARSSPSSAFGES
jgi:hypothetical protein